MITMKEYVEQVDRAERAEERIGELEAVVLRQKGEIVFAQNEREIMRTVAQESGRHRARVAELEKENDQLQVEVGELRSMVFDIKPAAVMSDVERSDAIEGALRRIVADARGEGREDMRDSVDEQLIEEARAILEGRTPSVSNATVGSPPRQQGVDAGSPGGAEAPSLPDATSPTPAGNSDHNTAAEAQAVRDTLMKGFRRAMAQRSSEARVPDQVWIVYARGDDHVDGAYKTLAAAEEAAKATCENGYDDIVAGPFVRQIGPREQDAQRTNECNGSGPYSNACSRGKRGCSVTHPQAPPFVPKKPGDLESNRDAMNRMGWFGAPRPNEASPVDLHDLVTIPGRVVETACENGGRRLVRVEYSANGSDRFHMWFEAWQVHRTETAAPTTEQLEERAFRDGYDAGYAQGADLDASYAEDDAVKAWRATSETK